jgi:subtilisin family serine protease
MFSFRKNHLSSRAAFVLAAWLLAAALPLSASAQGTSVPDYTAPDAPEVIPNEYIVGFEPGADADQAINAIFGEAETLGIETVQTDAFELINARVVRLPATTESIQASNLISILAERPGVAYVEPNYRLFALKTPNDPEFPNQYALKKINAETAWDTIFESPNVVVAVVDTGIDYKHPDLSRNMWTNTGETPGNNQDDDGNGIVDDIHGANFVPASATGDPMDDNRHGTHVAGTIGAVTDNNLQVAGVTYNVRLMALKFLDAQGRGSTTNAIRAIEYAIKHKADIMNNSWGGGGASQALRSAIDAANNSGILFVAAAGNSGKDNDAEPHYPSSYDVPNVLAVMATDAQDAMPIWTNFGAKSVDLAAPGASILSTVPGGGLQKLSGTSMATPHVAGAAALLKAQDPARTATDLKQILMDSVEIIPGLVGKSVTGGRLDLAKAVKPNDTCTGTVLLAYDEFFWPEKRSFSSNSNVLSVDFTLPSAMAVMVEVNGTARRTSGTGNSIFRTGVYTGASPNIMWTGSYRRGSYTADQLPRMVSSRFAINLPKGSHTMYWKLWLSNFTMEFDSANISVLAVPCSIGGKLKGLMAGEEEAGAILQAAPGQ